MPSARGLVCRYCCLDYHPSHVVSLLQDQVSESVKLRETRFHVPHVSLSLDFVFRGTTRFDEYSIKVCSYNDCISLWMTGWYQPPRVDAGTSVRILFFSGYAFSYFIYVIYSARLITVLRKIPDPIRTPEDLIDSPFTIGLKDEVDLKNWFEVGQAQAVANCWSYYTKEDLNTCNSQQGNGTGITTDNLITTRIMENLDPLPEKQYILEIPAALQVVNAEQYAFISYPDPIYQFLRSEHPDHDTCTLYREVVIIKSTFRCSMFVSKSSPYKEHFNYM